LADDGSAEHADGGGPTISAGLFFFFFAVRRQTVDNTALEVVVIHSKPPPLLIVRRRISTKPRLLVCSEVRGCGYASGKQPGPPRFVRSVPSTSRAVSQRPSPQRRRLVRVCNGNATCGLA